MKSAEKLCRVILIILAVLIITAGYTVVRVRADETVGNAGEHTEAQLKEHINIENIDMSAVETISADDAFEMDQSGTKDRGLQMLDEPETPLFNVDLSDSNMSSLIDPVLWAASAAVLVMIFVDQTRARRRMRVLQAELDAIFSEQGE